MSSTCSCVDVYFDYLCDAIAREVRTARKKHVCNECGGQIEPKQQYEHFRGVDEDRTPFTQRTCSVCLELRNVFFRGGWFFGEVRERLYEHILEIDGEVESNCILRLSREARNVVFDMIERTWEK